MTWTYNKDAVIIVVSAENCEMACHIVNLRLKQNNINQTCTNIDLVPVVTSTRWSRIFISGLHIKEASHYLKNIEKDSFEPKHNKRAPDYKKSKDIWK